MGQVTDGSLLARRVESTLARRYGLSGRLARIPTERDDTFTCRTAGGLVLVKVAASDEDAADIDLQIEAMRYLETLAPDVPVQRVIPSRDGSFCVDLDGDSRRILRVLEYIEGTIMGDAEPTPKLLAQVGRTHADMVVALTPFVHPHQSRHMPWDLPSVVALRPVVNDLATAANRALATDVLDTFDEVVVPRLSALDRQVVHADVSPFNVVVSSGDPHTVIGIIDFGDIVCSAVLFDLSVPVANQLDAAEEHPWNRAFPYLSGFLSRRPLADTELDLLMITAPTRLLIRILLTAQRAAADPARLDYLIAHGQHDWMNLEAAWSVVGDDLGSRIRSMNARPVHLDRP